MSLEFRVPDYAGSKGWTFESLKQELVRRFPRLPAVERTRFVMMAPLAGQVARKRKCTTIRHTPHAVEYPAKSTLPLFVVERGDRHEDAKPRGELRIVSIHYKPIRDLDERDAEKDGYRNRQELLHALHKFYGRLNPSDLVCIYNLEPAKAETRLKWEGCLNENHRRLSVSGRVAAI
jgi:hypothetical protein